jgi:hypothetical protein
MEVFVKDRSTTTTGMFDRFKPLPGSEEKSNDRRTYPDGISAPPEGPEKAFDDWIFWLLEFKHLITETFSPRQGEHSVDHAMEVTKGNSSFAHERDEEGSWLDDGGSSVGLSG